MFWNGKETGKWQIHAQTVEQFREIIGKLLKLGFVYTNNRLNTVDKILEMNRLRFPYISIGDGCCSECKMTLNGYTSYSPALFILINIDDWIANCWPAYDAA
jgi:hypothetical protein